MILYNSATAIIMYLKTREYLYIAIEGYPNMEKMNEFYHALLRGVAQSNANKFLFDTSRISVIKNEDMLWLSNNITPILLKHKGVKVAFIKPENVFGMKSVDTLCKLMRNSANACIFSNMEKAENWLFQ